MQAVAEHDNKEKSSKIIKKNHQSQAAAEHDNKEAVLLLLEHGFVPFSGNTHQIHHLFG